MSRLKRKTASVIMEISCKRVIWVKIIFILLLCIPLSPANIVKANNFYHTDSEVFFGGQWWVLESFATFCSSKLKVTVQEYASAATGGKRLELRHWSICFGCLPAANSDHSGVPRHEKLSGSETLATPLHLLLVFRIRLNPGKVLDARLCEPWGKVFEHSSPQSWLTWIENTLQCQSTWFSTPCRPSDSFLPNLSSKMLQKPLKWFSGKSSWKSPPDQSFLSRESWAPTCPPYQYQYFGWEWVLYIYHMTIWWIKKICG